MKVTYNWLKDFVEIRIPAQELAEKLTMAGLEVTSLEERDGDCIFEIEVTSNRPDCLSVIGIAREVAAITNSKCRTHSVERRAYSQNLSAKRYPLNAKNSQLFSIRVEDKKDCPLYTAKIIKDIKVGPSPEWLKKRLELIGCRSTNNIVDITNYILFEWGQPLHAFDLDKVVGQSPVTSHQLRIIVRRAKNGERITTIEGIKRDLDENILIIASDISGNRGDRGQETGRPIAIAGIMGGKDTEVTEETKNILLESAVFNPIVVRRGRRDLGIQSDSSYRFERGVNLEAVDLASWQATKLIQAVSEGTCVLTKGSGASRIKRKVVNLNLSTVHKILGVDIKASQVKKILNSLGLKVATRAKDNFAVIPLSHRQDINLEIDLIEEIARIWGFGKIRSTVPALIPQINTDDTRGTVSLIKNILVGLGLNEVITYSLMDEALLQAFEIEPSSVIEILNPLSKEQAVLRPALIPSLCACVAYNLNQRQDYVDIFEVAKVFSGDSAEPREELVLGIVLCGTKSLLLEQGLIKDNLGNLHLKGILDVLFERLGIKDYRFVTDNPYETGIHVGKEKVGLIARLPKSVQDRLDIKNKDVVAGEILLDRVLPYVNLQKRFVGLPVYPGISRDISIILKEEILAEDILKALREKASSLLKEIMIVDYYKGKQIPHGFKGLTISCLYRSDERTLTEAEVEPIHSSVCGVLIENFHAQIR